ncbi:MAG TPA: hypothetical protein VF941_24660 [Clostridia bacterium]
MLSAIYEGEHHYTNNHQEWSGKMYCPKCKCEYRDRFSICSHCNIDLVDLSQEDQRENEKNNIRIKKDLAQTLSKSIHISTIILILEVLIFVLLFFLNKQSFRNFNEPQSYAGSVFFILTIVNSTIIPVFLSIYNLVLNMKAKMKSYLVNLLIVEISLIILFIISLVGVYFIDSGILFGYEKKQEVTGSLFFTMGLIISIITGLVAGLINQIILKFMK